ncbi:MAG TPA: DUF2849 domain-containing protein [Rhizomicrobium sp.]|jgi:hypothetical protein|nr:DUF2849 domain-containing protein [Rhizomicrobium sp.]
MTAAMPAPTLQVLTANRLRDGAVLYRKGEGWVLTLAEADIYADKASADAALAAATAELARNLFVAPYLFEVRRQDDRVVPVKEREIIRAAGPTTYLYTGKQAGQFPPDPALEGPFQTSVTDA